MVYLLPDSLCTLKAGNCKDPMLILQRQYIQQLSNVSTATSNNLDLYPVPCIVEHATQVPEWCNIVRLAVILGVHSPHRKLHSASRHTHALWQGHCDLPQRPCPLPAPTPTCSQCTVDSFTLIPLPTPRDTQFLHYHTVIISYTPYGW